MKFVWWKRATALSIALGLTTLSLQGCGGGSSRASGQAGGGFATATVTFTVSLPEATPTPILEPIIVRDNVSLNSVLNTAPPGSTIIVLAGTYAPISLTGEDRGPLTVIADVEGVLVQDAIQGDATILGNRNVPAVELIGQSDITFDGFQFRGGRDATVRIVNSPGTDIRHCRISGSRADGILVEGTDDIILFNNAIYGHAASGIQILDVGFVEVYNNTIYGNGRSGVSIGSSLQPASGITVRNNIFSKNESAGISVEAGSDVNADYNLNNDGLRGIAAAPHDINGDTAAQDPLFHAPDLEDFHMANGLTTSISPAIDTGDPSTPGDFVVELRVRTTEISRLRDTGPIDRGYHYPFAIVATPTPNPTLTPTNTRGSAPPTSARSFTPTPTPTPTPTTTATPTIP